MILITLRTCQGLTDPLLHSSVPRADLGGGCRGWAPPPPAKKKTMWFIGVEVEQETTAPPPKKNPGSTLERESSLLFE